MAKFSVFLGSLLSVVLLGCNTFGDVEFAQGNNQTTGTNNQTIATNNQTTSTNNQTQGFAAWRARCEQPRAVGEPDKFGGTYDGAPADFSMAWLGTDGEIVFLKGDAAQLIPLQIKNAKVEFGQISEGLGDSFISAARVFRRDADLIQSATIPTQCDDVDKVAAYFGVASVKLETCGAALTDVGYIGGFNPVSQRNEVSPWYAAIRPREFLVINDQLLSNGRSPEFQLGPRFVSSAGENVLVWDVGNGRWHLYDPIRGMSYDTGASQVRADLVYIGRDGLKTVYALLNGTTLIQLIESQSELQPFEVPLNLPMGAVAALTAVPGGFVVGYSSTTSIGWRLFQITSDGGFLLASAVDDPVEQPQPKDVKVGVAYLDGCEGTVLVVALADANAGSVDFEGASWHVPAFFGN
ncbi:MAG: hypothetical protein R3E66_20490 [bacterium]